MREGSGTTPVPRNSDVSDARPVIAAKVSREVISGRNSAA